MQAERLLYGALEFGDFTQGLVAHFAPIRVELIEFRDHLLQVGWMSEQFDQGPCGASRSRVVPGEHQGNEHAGDLVDGIAGLSVFVLEAEQYIEEFGYRIRIVTPLLENFRQHAYEPLPGPIARAKCRQGKMGVHVCNRIGSLLEFVEDLKIFRSQRFPELLSDQTRTGGIDRQFGEEVEQIDFTAIAQPRHHAANL